jgi:hypothetical protein
MSVEMDQREAEELAEPKRKLRLPGSARAQDQDPVSVAESFDLASVGHHANTTGGDSKMNAGLNVEL